MADIPSFSYDAIPLEPVAMYDFPPLLRPDVWRCLCGSLNGLRQEVCACGHRPFTAVSPYLNTAPEPIEQTVRPLRRCACGGVLMRGVDACFDCQKTEGASHTGDASDAKRRGVSVGLVTNAIKDEGSRWVERREWRGVVRVLRRDVEIKRKLQNASARVKNAMNTIRGEITELSAKALRRLVKTARNVQDLDILVTLTYPEDYPTDGKVVKYHFRRFRQWLVENGVKGFWFLEFQKRGAPHIHIFADKYIDHMKVRRKWCSIVDSHDPKHLLAGTRVEGMRENHAMAAYAEKYASKQEQKDVPEGYENVGRFWGMFGGLKIEETIVASGPLGSGSVERQGETSIAPALRVVEKLYSLDRQKLRDKGVKVKQPNFGYGTRSYTAYGMAGSVANALVRLGLAELVPPEVCA